MRLRYFLGLVATLSLTACSVDVDVYPTSKLTVIDYSSWANEKVMLVNSDQTVINVTRSKPIELINGTYDLLYVQSAGDIYSITGYDYGSLDYSKALIACKSNVVNASYLDVHYDHQTITLPGAGTVTVNPQPLTQDYTVVWTVTAAQEAAFKEKPTGGVFGNVPSSFSLKTGKLVEGGKLKVNFSFNAPVTLASGDVQRTAIVRLPIMETVPSKMFLQTSNSSKACEFTIDNTTITIK